MSSFHVGAVCLSLLAYAILGMAYFGWGRALCYVMGLDRGEKECSPVTFAIWTGWAFTLFLWEVTHFVLPIQYGVVLPVLVLGIALFVCFRPTLSMRGCLASLGRAPVRSTTILAVFLLVTAWIASRSMLPPTNFDSGLYHFNAIRWRNTFPIVPGLGNLHGRLAFNQTFFTYVAALNFHPLLDQGRSLANSFLLVLALCTFVEILIPVIKRPKLVVQLPPLQWGVALFALPIAGYWALSSNGLASPSTDLPSGLLQLVLFVMFAQLLNGYARDRMVPARNAFILSVLLATAITLKMSNLVFASVIMALLLLGMLGASERRARNLVKILVPALLILLVWCGRSYLLSGAPLYPSTIGYSSEEWSVPIHQVMEEGDRIYSWARRPRKDWRGVLGNWDWLDPWLKFMVTVGVDFVFPLIIFGVVTGAHVVAGLFCKVRFVRDQSLQWLLYLPLIAGLVFWFFTAPSVRFANAILFLMPVSSVLLLLSFLRTKVSVRMLMGTVCLLFFACNLNYFFYSIQNRATLSDVSTSGWGEIPQSRLVDRTTFSGLEIKKTLEDGVPWDSPIPCAITYNPRLRTLTPGDLSSGFSVREPSGAE